MPTFATGNAQWDQNLSTLGNALFPDPSKAGEAFYYGAKAREAQVDTSKKLDQLNSGNLATGYIASGNRPALNLQQGPGGATILQGPDASSAAPLPPPLMTSNVGPQVSGTAGSAPGPGFMAGAPQPVLPQANPTNPAANQAIIGALTDKVQSGPGPEPTGSDGTRPQNSYGYGSVPAGTVTPPGGGVRMAPNARPDGSPDLAKLDFGLLFNLGVRAGNPPEAVAAGLRAVLATGRRNGQISQVDAEQQAALLGEASMRNQALANAGALARTIYSENAATGRQNIVTGEQAREYNQAIERGVDAQGNPVAIRRVDVAPGQQLYPGDAVAAERQRQGGQYGDYLDAQGNIHHVPASTANANQWTSIPSGTDPFEARLRTQLFNAKPEERQDIMDRAAAMATLPKPVTEQESFQRRADAYNLVNEAYPQTQQTAVPLGITNPAALTGPAETAVYDRMRELQAKDKNLFFDPATARQRAIQDLQVNPDRRTGLVLPTPDQVNAARVEKFRSRLYGGSDPRVKSYTPPGQTTADHMMIDLVKPGGQFYPPGGAAGAAAPGGHGGAAAAATPTTSAHPALTRSGQPVTPLSQQLVPERPAGTAPNRPVSATPPPEPVTSATPNARTARRPGATAAPAATTEPVSGIFPTGTTTGTSAPAFTAAAPTQTAPAPAPAPVAQTPLPGAGLRMGDMVPPGVPEGKTGVINATGQRFVVHGGRLMPQ